MWGISRLLLIIALFLLPTAVFAFELEPTSINTNGEAVEILVRNTSNTIKTYSVSLDLVEIDSITGTIAFLGSAEDVATVESTQIIVQPGERQEIVVTPEPASEGLYTLALLVTDQDNGAGIVVEEAIASLIFYTSGALTPIPQVSGASIIVDGPTVFAESIWRNEGEGLLIPAGSLLQRSIFGRELRSDAVNQASRRVLPNSERLFITEAPLSTGIFGLTRISYTVGEFDSATILVIRPHISQLVLILVLLPGIMLPRRHA